MKQRNIAQVNIQYYSPKRVFLEVQKSGTDDEKATMQLLLISILNFINVIHNLKNDAENVLREMKLINDDIKNTPHQKSDISKSEFIPQNEILKANHSGVKEFIIINLVQKGESIYLETDSRDQVNPFYKYSSVRALFQSVLNFENEEITLILNESLDYIFDYYKNVSDYTEVKSLIELTHYFSELFVDFLVE